MPYSYDEYTNGYTATSAPQVGSTTMRTIDDPVWNATNGPGTNVYRPGMSNREYVRENLGFGGNRYAAQNMAHGLLNPVGGVLSGISAYRGFKKSQDKYRDLMRQHKNQTKVGQANNPTDWLNTVDPEAAQAIGANATRALDVGGVKRTMTGDEINSALRTRDQNAMRSQYESSIDEYFSDPARASWQQGIVQNRLQNDLANVRDDYDMDLTSAGQSAASRGLRGGSVDIEGRGAAARTRDTRAIGAASNADAALAEFRSGDQTQRQQLMGLVNSGTIADSDALRSALDTIHQQTAQSGARYAGQQRQRQIDQFGNRMTSQAYGQGLNAIAGAINRNPNSWYAGGSDTSYGGW